MSFDVAPGEVLGLVGPNGAGKTTTLRCLAGIIAPSQRHGGDRRPRHAARRRSPAKRALAFIPDEPHLFEYLSVEEHLRFIARLYGVADVEARMPGLLDELELTEKRTRAARRAVARHAAEARDRLRAAARSVGAHSRRAAHRPRSRRHAPHARDDRRARAAAAPR